MSDDDDLLGEVPASNRRVSKKDNMSNATEEVAQDQLRSFVERIERLEEEKKTIAEDIKDVYAEAKGSGFDSRVLRKVIAMRKQDASERQEFEAILSLYLQALGMHE